MDIKERYERYINQQIEKQYKNTAQTTCKNELNITKLVNGIEEMSKERYLSLYNLIIESDINTLHKHIYKKTFTITELVLFYLKRIYDFDKNIKSVIELNPDAIEIAKKLDIKLNKGTHKGKLFGIPVLLKDNIGTGDKMHNTAGAKIMENSQCDKDAFIVKKLRDAGAIILGKANLSEWANCMSLNSANGYSALGGQTKNAFGVYDVGGSSSGSSVATSLNLTAVSIGTETEGSIIYPASQNGVVGVKLSTGLWSKDRIIPITKSMDTAGPITRTVSDAAILIGELVGEDYNDKDTILGSKQGKKDYTKYLVEDGLKGTKIGLVINEKYYDISYGEKEILERITKELENLGAIVKQVRVIEDKTQINYNDILMYEYRVGVNNYLANYTRDKLVNNILEIIDYNKEDINNRAIYGQDVIETAQKTTITEDENTEKVQQMRKVSRTILNTCLAENEVDILLSLSVNLSSLYATAGYPAVTVPAGFRENGEPIGMTLISKMFSEDILIKAAFAYEQGTKYRTKPCIKKLQ